MPRLRFTIGRLFCIPLILSGALGLLDTRGVPSGVALPSAVCMSVGLTLLLLASRDRRELIAAYLAVTTGVIQSYLLLPTAPPAHPPTPGPP